MAISYHTQKQASFFKLLQKGNEGAAVSSPFIPIKMIIIIVNGIVYFLEVPKSTQGYEGATLINTRSQILGELESTTGEVLRAQIGDWQNTLGFIDFGGTPIAIPRNKLVFGKKQTLGYVFVVLAEEINQEEAIERYDRQ